MTRDELIADVWHDLPVSKYLLGRARVDRITARALKAWHPPVLDQCDEAQCRIVNKYLARSIERQERNEYGMGFLAAILLSAIIGEIVKILLRRWLENRTAMLEAIR